MTLTIRITLLITISSCFAMENNRTLPEITDVALTMSAENQLEPVEMVYESSFTTRTKQFLCRCCVPKLTKLVVSSCICGRSCTETIKSFGEVKAVSTFFPYIKSLFFNPYCWATTACVATASVGCLLYRNNSCTLSCCTHEKAIDI